MNIIFFGSSEISIPFLEEVHGSRHRISLVVTSEDKQAGRGLKVVPNIVKKKAESLGIDFIQIEKFDNYFYDKFNNAGFDAALVVSFGKIIPERVFKIAGLKWFNVHQSLLPKYRGPAPVVSTLLNGDDIGGVSIIEVVPEVDAGCIYAQISFKVEKDDNRDSMDKKCIIFGKPLLIAVLDMSEDGILNPYPQDEKGVVYGSKIAKEDLKINWNSGAGEIVNKIRAFSSKPGAYFLWKDIRVKALGAGLLSGEGRDGFKTAVKTGGRNGLVVMADKKAGIVVQCGKDELVRIDRLQLQGKSVISSSDFVNGYRLKTGERFE